METSAIYAVGMFRKIKVGNILIMNMLTNPKARSIGFYSDALRESILEVAKIVKKTIEYLADTP